MIMNNKLLNGLLVLIAAVIAPLAIVTASTVGASILPENRAGAYYTQGIEHLEQGQLDLALEDLNQAIESDPQNPEAYHFRGYVYDELGHYDLAINDFTRAIELGVDSPDWTYSYRGISYAQSGDLPRALNDLNEAIKINPDFADAYFFRGLIYSELGNSEQAISDLEKSLKLDLEPELKELAEDFLAELRQ
jgi:tetratricopeptide (TPR) repeat protein